jgi:hypothetical protein
MNRLCQLRSPKGKEVGRGLRHARPKAENGANEEQDRGAVSEVAFDRAQVFELGVL